MHHLHKLTLAITAGLLLPACVPEVEAPKADPVEISFLTLSGADTLPLDFEPYVINSKGEVHLLADINPAGSSDAGISESPEQLNGNYFFSADDGVNGRELWVTDGTTTGTQLLKDIGMGKDGNPRAFKTLNGKIYFSASQDTVVGGAIWISDGTAAGTELFKDLRSDNGGTGISQWIAFNDKLYFATYSGQGNELHVTDGTVDGTAQLFDLRPGSSGSAPSEFAILNDTLFFEATDGNDVASGEHSFSLFKTDGTEAGTSLVKDINPNPNTSEFAYSEARIDNMIVLNDVMLFEATNGTDGNTLWRSDGTEAGTFSLVDIYPQNNAQLSEFTIIGNTAYFYASDATGEALWKTDGTKAGTALIKRFENVRSIAALGNKLLISVSGTGYYKIYVSDGTEVGTSELTTMNGSSYFVTTLGNYAFFSCDSDDDDLDELWKTDATAAGTTQAMDGDGNVVVFYDD
ncbi:Uncharacterised protein [BD1-7 clade bacterium]|uniref:Hyalin n=1 Tax=BD1-7 clade bacterium TaxID=2029982 RepID=A0A5S9PK90_9GAMM|nr:Uncharacterised protein [BD1-7 clade bacterium]CAA0104720.1 Uncharacterised protein [BD1-7 clade bacterium]